MDAAGLAVAATKLCFSSYMPTVDTRLGCQLVEIWKTWRLSENEVAERTATVETTWMKARIQILFVERIAPTLAGYHRQQLSNILAILATKLSLAIKVARLIKDMDDWGARFDPSWYLIMLIASNNVDQGLGHIVQEQKEQEKQITAIQGLRLHDRINTVDSGSVTSEFGLSDATYKLRAPQPIITARGGLEVVEVPYGRAKAARRKGATSKWLIVDSVLCSKSSHETALLRDVRNLARELT
ncbi:hypothetical protein HD806DRAFT_527428 [Xylariaceae sp. AK1471]|nr:hypothetical protein HD806DRAFT_527428 [Xylariaceae sp. AK1471]